MIYGIGKPTAPMIKVLKFKGAQISQKSNARNEPSIDWATVTFTGGSSLHDFRSPSHQTRM